jgi:hypothetical protein
MRSGNYRRVERVYFCKETVSQKETLMKKLILALIVGVALALPTLPAFAYPPCSAFQAPNQYEQFCRYDVTANDTYRVAPGIPFAWLRSAASSAAPPVYTVYPSTGASMVTVTGGQWDGYQWWWQVETYPNRRARGWVEMASLQQVVQQSAPSAPVPTPTIEGISDPSIQIQAQWTTPFRGRVEDGTPFLWVRAAPNSGPILYTLRPGTQFEVTGSPGHDGFQWWWPVEIRSGSTVIDGWVEQGSITPSG